MHNKIVHFSEIKCNDNYYSFVHYRFQAVNYVLIVNKSNNSFFLLINKINHKQTKCKTEDVNATSLQLADSN